MCKLSLILLSAYLGSCIALPADFEPRISVREAPPLVFQGCSSQQITILNSHLDDMAILAWTAAANVGVGNFWNGIFGQYRRPGLSDDDIRRRYQAIAQAKTKATSGTVTIRCDSRNASHSSCWDSGFGAPAMTTNAGVTNQANIWVCDRYWQRPLRISQIKVPPAGIAGYIPLDPFIPTAGYLLHEWTHALYATTDERLQGRPVYGQEMALRLGRASSSKARQNADNYNIFAAMVTVKRKDNNLTPWSTNPDYLGAIGRTEL